MVTTTGRGWPAFAPALLAFTVVVCGSASRAATAQAPVFEDSHPPATTGSLHGLSAAAGRDRFATRDSEDNGDGSDGGEVGGVFVAAAAAVMTADDDSSRTLDPAQSGAVSALAAARLAPRGPPAPAQRAYTREDFERDQDTDVIVDDDDHDDDEDSNDDDDGRDDDGSASEVAGAAHAVGIETSAALIGSTSNTLCSFASDNLSLRAPPR